MGDTTKHPNRVAKDKLRDAAIEERRREVYRVWLTEKKSVRELAVVFGVAIGTIHADLKAETERIIEAFDEEIRPLRAKQLNRLLKQYTRFEKIAMEEQDVHKSTKAGTLCLGILKEINEVLGVKAAVKVEHSGAIDLTGEVKEDIDSIYGELEAKEIA